MPSGWRKESSHGLNQHFHLGQKCIPKCTHTAFLGLYHWIALEHANSIRLRWNWTISVLYISLICAAVPNGCSVHGPKLELVEVRYHNEHITDFGFSRASVLLGKLALISPYCFHLSMHMQNSSLGGMVWPGALHHGCGGSTFLCWSFFFPLAHLLTRALSSVSMIKQSQVLHPQAGRKKLGEAANPQTLRRNLAAFF